MKKTAFWLPRSSDATRSLTMWPIGPSTLRFCAPTITTVACGVSTRLSSDHDLLPATSSSRS
jgi:hypothetical protein